MDILDLNEKAWDKIGKNIVSPYIKSKDYKQMFDLFCKKLPKNGEVLDFGCGPGLPFAKELSDIGFKVTGIDLSKIMVKEAQKNVPKAKFKQVSMTKIKFIEKFAGVFSSYTMLCLNPENFSKAAKKAVRALKPKGIMFLSVNEPDKKVWPEGDNYCEIMGQKMYSRPYSEKEIRQYFEPLGMKILKVKRETTFSKAYGEEHTLIVIMEKK